MNNRKITIKIRTATGVIEEKTGIKPKIVKSNEPWSEYELEDGTILKIKNVLVDLVRLDEKLNDGTYRYTAKIQNIIVAEEQK